MLIQHHVSKCSHQQCQCCSSSLPSLPADDRLSQCIANNFPLDANIILCIFPAAGSTLYGYVYIIECKQDLQVALMVSFDSCSHSVTVLPCPEFDLFLTNNAIVMWDIRVINYLPPCIIPAGMCILEETQYKDSPNLDPFLHFWTPSTSSPSPLLGSIS